MRTRLRILVVAIVGIAGVLHAGPGDPGARTTWVGITTAESVLAAGGDREALLRFAPFVDWDPSGGAAQPIGASLQVHVTQVGGGFDQTFVVPVEVPTSPGIQRPLTGPGGTRQEGGAFPIPLPGGALTNTLAFTAEATYQVDFGAGTGTGSSVNTAVAHIDVLPESTLLPGEPVVSCSPMTPGVGRFDVRRGTSGLVGFLIENNDPDRPFLLTCTVTGNEVSVAPTGLDPDGAGYGVGEAAGSPLLLAIATGEPEGFTEQPVPFPLLVPADGVAILPVWVQVPGDAAPFAAWEIEARCSAVPLGEPGAAALSCTSTALVVGEDRPAIAGSATITDRVVSGAFTSTEWSPARFTVHPQVPVGGEFVGGFGGSAVVSSHEDIVSVVDIDGRTVKTIGIGAQGWSPSTIEHLDSVDTPGAASQCSFESSSARGTGVLLFTHNDTQVTLDRTTEGLRIFEIGTGPNSFANLEVKIDVPKDRIVVSTPKFNNQPSQTLHSGSYSELIQNGAEGLHVFKDTFREISVLPPGGSAHRVEVFPSLFVGPAAERIENKAFRVEARTVGGKEVPYFALPGGPLQTASGDIGTGTGDLFFGSVTLTPSTTVAAVARVNTNGSAADTATAYLPIALRQPAGPPPLPLDVPGLGGVFDLSKLDNDKATLLVQLTPEIVEEPLKGKAPFPVSCRRVIVDLGGVVSVFDLDEKGKARTADGNRSCKGKLKTGRDGRPSLQLKVNLKRLFLRHQLADDGVRNLTTGKGGDAVTVPVRVLVCGTLHAGNAAAGYTAKQGKKGKLKLRK